MERGPGSSTTIIFTLQSKNQISFKTRYNNIISPIVLGLPLPFAKKLCLKVRVECTYLLTLATITS